MAIIYSYPLNDDIGSSDELVGTTEKSINGQLKTVTRNFLLGDLSTFFIEKGGIQRTIILTTAGSNGPATLNTLTGELNIPQYSGATDLGYIASALNGIVTSSTGLDATIPLANSTIAGLLSPANFIVLSNTSGINTGDQDLQQVTDSGASTTKSITANSFIKIGGTGTNILLDDGDTVALSSIGGNTNLSTSQTSTNFTINSDTGTGASVPLGDGTLAGATLNNYTTTEKNKLAGIASGAQVNVNADWNATSGDAEILNKPIIPSITNLVPYTGATTDVNLGLNDITAAKLIKDGGFDFQFLKADGSVDNNTYLTSADLPSTLDLYATTSPDPVIAGYTALVRNISDTRYNTTAVNVPTPTITGTSVAPTFCGAVISDPSILLGNPGVFNFSVIGKIRRTGGSTSSGADFFFSIYKRNLAGVEELIANSAPVVVPANGGIYTEYISIALWNNGIFLSTDRVVLKFYGIKTGGGSGAAYQFLFGGADPVRGTAAISSAIIPNLYLRDLADVEKVPAENNEILYWNDPASLWEHELAENLVPLATATQKGLVSTAGQTFGGAKTFANNITASANIIGTNTPDISNASYSIIIRNASTGVFEKLGATTIQPLIYNILITSTAGITTQTLGTNGGLEYSQDGRNVMIANGTTPIQVTASNASSSFIASYTKLGTANITFATSGTLVAPYGAILNGNPGSTALLTKNGTTVYLLVNNLL